MTRITTSFVEPPRLTRWIFVGTIAAAAAFAGMALWLAFDWMSARDELPTLEQQLANLESRRDRDPQDGQHLLSSAQLGAMVANVKELNRMSVVRGLTAMQLLDRIEAELPSEVYLVSLHHKAREGEALLVAEAANDAALTKFLLKLEAEKEFSEVLLNKQSTRATGAEQTVQFEVRLRFKS
jgi:Tfp pilus assembly protein PilN